jgi:hypothetical protein
MGVAVGTHMKRYVTGIYRTYDSAARAVDELVRAGCSPNDISVLMSEQTRALHFAAEPKTKAPEGAAVGGALGAIAGGLTALASLAVPGGIVVAGPILAALGGAGLGAVGGGLIGGLLGLGITEHEARLYSDELRRGGILVAVWARPERVPHFERVLERTGALGPQPEPDPARPH